MLSVRFSRFNFFKVFLPFSYKLQFHVKMRGSRSIAVCLSINNNFFFEFDTIRAFFFPLEETKSLAFSAIMSSYVLIFYFKSCVCFLFKFELVQIFCVSLRKTFYCFILFFVLLCFNFSFALI